MGMDIRGLLTAVERKGARDMTENQPFSHKSENSKLAEARLSPVSLHRTLGSR